MKCDLCHQEFGLSHSCPGAFSPAAQLLLADDAPPPLNGGPIYYLGEAWKIARWDDVAIRRNAKDPRATFFSIVFWLIATLLVTLISTLPLLTRRAPNTRPAVFLFVLIFALIFSVLAIALVTFLQLTLCHAIAKWFFGAKGKFIEVMRPLLLGWFVNCLTLIPVAGTLLAAIAWTAVLMMVFEEVDEISRLQAFGISAGINLCIFVLEVAFLPAFHL
jgi:hypothetical protein